MNELVLIVAMWPSLGNGPVTSIDPNVRPAQLQQDVPDGPASVIFNNDTRVLKPGLEFGYSFPVGVAHFPRRISSRISVPDVYESEAQLPSIRAGYLAAEASLGFRPERLPGDFLATIQGGSAGRRSLIGGLAPTGPSVMTTSAGLLLLDLMYNFRPRLGPAQFAFSFGSRLANLTYDREALHLTLERRIETSYFGAGPGGGLGLEVPIGGRWGPFFQVNGGVMFGKARQRFYDVTYGGSYPGGAPGHDFTILEEDTERGPEGRFVMAQGRETIAESRAVPYLTVLAGITVVDPLPRKRSFQIGYEYQQFWDPVTVGASGGHLSTHGVIVRWLINY